MFTGFRTTRFHICPSESPLVTGLWSLFVWLITLQNVARKSGPGSKKMVHRSAKYGSIFCRVVNKCGSIISTLALIKTWFRHRYGAITSRGFDVVNGEIDSDCRRSRIFLRFTPRVADTVAGVVDQEENVARWSMRRARGG